MQKQLDTILACDRHDIHVDTDMQADTGRQL